MADRVGTYEINTIVWSFEHLLIYLGQPTNPTLVHTFRITQYKWTIAKILSVIGCRNMQVKHKNLLVQFLFTF